MSPSAFVRPLDYVFVTRPLILIPVWSFFLLGLHAGPEHSSLLVAFGSNQNAAYCLTAILIVAYLINQIFDRESDIANNKGHFLTQGIIGIRTVVIMAVLFFLVATYTFRLTASYHRPVLTAALLLSLAYSTPPIRLCARPLVDLIANAVGYGGIAFFCGYLSLATNSTSAWYAATPYMCLVGATYLYTTILDVDGDRVTGKRTTSVAIGIGPSALAAAILAIAAAIVSLYQWRVGHLGVVSPIVNGLGAVVFVSAWTRIRHADQTKIHRVASQAVQLATLIVTAAACLVFPRYLLLIVPLVLASRVYYRLRFGLSYPGPTNTS